MYFSVKVNGTKYMSGQFESCVFVSRGNKNNDGPDFRGQMRTAWWFFRCSYVRMTVTFSSLLK